MVRPRLGRAPHPPPPAACCCCLLPALPGGGAGGGAVAREVGEETRGAPYFFGRATRRAPGQARCLARPRIAAAERAPGVPVPPAKFVSGLAERGVSEAFYPMMRPPRPPSPQAWRRARAGPPVACQTQGDSSGRGLPELPRLAGRRWTPDPPQDAPTAPSRFPGQSTRTLHPSINTPAAPRPRPGDTRLPRLPGGRCRGEGLGL